MYTGSKKNVARLPIEVKFSVVTTAVETGEGRGKSGEISAGGGHGEEPSRHIGMLFWGRHVARSLGNVEITSMAYGASKTLIIVRQMIAASYTYSWV